MKKTDLFSFERTLLVKLILLFLLCNYSGVNTHAEAYAETVNFTIRSQNLSLKDILSYIEENSEFIFVYHGQNIDLNKTVDIHLTDQPISTILENLFSQTDTEYIIRDRQIILRKKAEEKTTSVPVITQPATIQVRGTIFDDTGEPVIGANVIEKGTTNGAITNLDGEFTLTVHPNAVLVVTYIGFEEQQIEVNNRQLFTIRLQQDLKSLDEVVVVGYGVQRKVNMTGSVATISSDAIESRPLTNVSTALAGLAAGVRVNQTSARPGDDSATIRVRGQGALNSDNSSALVVIDGIPGTLDAVNPNDIESISILKDAASSAIYGTRAANGVILVTTKKGTSGKPKVTFTGTLSLAQPTRLPEFISDYATYMELVNEGYLNGGSTAKYTDTDIQTWREAAKNPNGLTEYGFPNYVAYPNTDWASAVFENNWIQNYNLSVTGGSEDSKYAISAGYLNNPGIISNTGIEKFQTRINLETKMGKFLTVGTQTFMSLQKNGLKDTSSSMLAYIQQNVPGQYPYQYDGYWAAPSSDKESTQLGSLTAGWHNTGGKSLDTRVNTTLFARIDILKGLSFETKVNYQLYQKESNTYPVNQKRKNFVTNLEIDISNAPSQMTTTYKFSKEYTLTYDNVLTYQFNLNKQHNFAFLLGHNEYYWNERYDFSASKKGLIAEGMYVPSSAGEEETKFAGNERDRAMRSYFGRVNYDYKGKYMFEFNLRRDASSRFGTEMRWGNFPSVSGAWRLSEESFLLPVKQYFQNLKLRASWGRLGSDNAGNYDYQLLYGIYYYSFNDIPVTALAQKKTGNPYLHWEETEVIDVAIEGTTFDGRLNFELDFYNKYTKGILTTPSIPGVAGNIDGPTLNTSDVLNRGVELTVGWRDRIGKVNYNVRGNFSYNFDQVKNYLGKYVMNSDGTNNIGLIGSADSNDANRYIVEGYRIGEYYLRETYSGTGTYFHSDGTVNIHGGPRDGMIRTEQDMNWVLAMQAAGYTFSPQNSIGPSQLYYGDLLYADLNNDGIYGDSNDQTFTGKSPLPKYNYGFTIDLEWNNFDLSMIWSGSAGMHYHFLATGYNSSQISGNSLIPVRVANDHYYYNVDNPGDPANKQHGLYPRLTSSTTINGVASTRWLYNASYLKLKNLQIGYTIPAKITERYKIANLRIFATGENLLMFTKYPFMDPERGQV